VILHAIFRPATMRNDAGNVLFASNTNRLWHIRICSPSQSHVFQRKCMDNSCASH